MQLVEVSSFTRVLYRFYIGDRDVVMLQANFKFIIYKGKLSSGSMQYIMESTEKEYLVIFREERFSSFQIKNLHFPDDCFENY